MHARRTVLLVEDEAIIAMDLRAKLEQAGFDVVATVSKSEDVVSAVQRHRPMIVLMDIGLRGDVDGIALAEEIFVCEDIPVVFLSAFAHPSIYKRAASAGAYGYLTKPVRQAALVATLEMAIQKHLDLQGRRDDAQRLGVMLNTLTAALVALDEEGRVRFMNHAAVKLTGWRLLDAKGERPPFAEQLVALGPDARARGVELLLTIRTTASPLLVHVKTLSLTSGGSVSVISPVLS